MPFPISIISNFNFCAKIYPTMQSLVSRGFQDSMPSISPSLRARNLRMQNKSPSNQSDSSSSSLASINSARGGVTSQFRNAASSIISPSGGGGHANLTRNATNGQSLGSVGNGFLSVIGGPNSSRSIRKSSSRPRHHRPTLSSSASSSSAAYSETSADRGHIQSSASSGSSSNHQQRRNSMSGASHRSDTS